jgi:hypothetical protein
MLERTRFGCVCGAMLALSGVACSSNDKNAGATSSNKQKGTAGQPAGKTGASDAGGSKADGGPEADASANDAGGPAVAVSGTIRDYSTSEPLAGMRICLYFPKESPQPCTKSAADGHYEIAMPQNAMVGLSYVLAGYTSEILIGLTGSETAQQLDYSAFPTATTDALAGAAGQKLDATKAQLFVSVTAPSSTPGLGAGVSGVTMAISPSSGAGPFYASSSGLPDTGLTSTSAFGLAAFVNVEPGQSVIALTPPSGSCAPSTPGASWPGTGPNSTTAVLVAGYLTHVTVPCN